MGEGRAVERWEAVAAVAIVLLAAVLRFIDLPTRGTWDADQGHDMTVLWSLVHEGVVPLLGPPTSIGDFHHGVLYYYLLAPAAIVSGADPLVVVGFIALCGVAAVGVGWWLGRAVGGPVGGPVAGLVVAGLMAVSASAIEESTFIWNPNLIALSSAISLAAAWRAWTTRDWRWWNVVAVAQTVTQHLHVLGWVLLVPLAALLVADARRGTRGVRGALLAWVAVVLASYVPLLVSELSTSFAETRALVDYVAGGGGGDAAPVALRLAVVPLRVLSWPLAGLITDQPVASLLVAALVVAVLAWRIRAARGGERTAAVWFAGTLAWCSVGLAVGASSLASVVPGLPNDHYHAFLDPIVFVTVGLGASALWRRRPEVPARVAVAVVVVLLVALNVSIWPPRVAPDGGYPAHVDAATRIIDELGGADYVLEGLPQIKNADAIGFPLRRLGHPPIQLADPMGMDAFPLVIACDRLLEPIIETACGGPAEDAFREGYGEWELVSRFDASDRTVVSVYR